MYNFLNVLVNRFSLSLNKFFFRNLFVFSPQYIAEVARGQEINFEIYDLDDGISKDEFIGR